jgi:phosphatidylglycerophosphatase C
MKTKVYAFDFDGTLTTKDTFLEFIRYAKGTTAMLLGFALHAPLLVLMKLGVCSNGKVKQRVFSYFFKGMNIEKFNTLCQRFASDNRAKLLRPRAAETMRQACESGAVVLVVSASIDNWVIPFFHASDKAGTLPHEHSIEVIGTQIEVQDGIVTGRFSTPNCYGREKVRRMNQRLEQERSEYEITAFGDSRGDREMLNDADQGYYKPFRQ